MKALFAAPLPLLLFAASLASPPAYAQRVSARGEPADDVRNIAAVTPFALHGPNVAFGVAYERFFSPRQRVSFYLPVNYVTSIWERTETESAGTFSGNGPAEGYKQSSVRSPRIAAYPGVKFYTGKGARVLRYGAGFSAMVEIGRYGYVRNSFYNTVPEQLSLHEEVYHTRVRIGPLITQSLNVFAGKRVYAGLEGGVGWDAINTQPRERGKPELFGIASVRVGYRF